MRLRLEDRFDEVPGEISVVIHPTPAWLAAAHPFLPLARWAAAPAGRRYLAGWAMATELHILNDEHADRRAGGHDSQRALRGTADRLYTQVVLAANNAALPPPWGPRRFARYLRWAWLIEGGCAVLLGPGAALPRRGDPADARGEATDVPAIGAATRSSSAGPSSTCSTARSAAPPPRYSPPGPGRGGLEASIEIAFDAPLRGGRARLAPPPARADRAPAAEPEGGIPELRLS